MPEIMVNILIYISKIFFSISFTVAPTILMFERFADGEFISGILAILFSLFGVLMTVLMWTDKNDNYLGRN